MEVLRRPDVQVDGKIHVPTVTRLTGISGATIYSFLKSDRYLKAKLKDVDASKIVPTIADQVDRPGEPTMPALPVDFSKQEMEEALAVRRQEFKALQKDWTALGMTAEEGERWEHYSKMGSAPGFAVLRGVGGQLLSNLGALQALIEKDSKAILEDKVADELGKDGKPLARSYSEREARIVLLQEIELHAKIWSHCYKNQAIMAKVMADLRRSRDAKPTVAKGEFTVREQKET
jgi:hypothetical protein